MTRKLLIVGAILLSAMSGWAAQETARPDRDAQALNASSETAVVQVKDSLQISPADGTALLDLFLDSLRDMAQRGTLERHRNAPPRNDGRC